MTMAAGRGEGNSKPPALRGSMPRVMSFTAIIFAVIRQVMNIAVTIKKRWETVISIVRAYQSHFQRLKSQSIISAGNIVIRMIIIKVV